MRVELAHRVNEPAFSHGDPLSKTDDFPRRLPTPVRDHIIRPLVESLPRRERLKRAVRSLGNGDVTKRFAQVRAVFSEPMKAALLRPGVRAAVL